MDELRNEEMQDEELERYGVWVKAGPEEVMEADDDFSFADLPQDSGGTDDDVFGDAGTPDEGTGPDTDRSDDSAAADDLAAVDEFDDLSLDDLDFPDDLDEETPTEEQPEGLYAAEPTDEGETEFDLPDFGDEDTPGDDDEDVSLTLADEDDDLTIDAIDSAAASLEEPEEVEDDLVSLDDLDIDVPDEDPDPFSSLESDDESTDDESADDDLDLDELTEELPDDFEELDLDAADPLAGDSSEEFDSSIPGSDDELSDISVDDITVDDTSEDLPELEADEIEADETGTEHDFTPETAGIEIVESGPSNRLTPDEEEFLDEDLDLQNESESAIPPSMDLQEREAFERIQTELSDIKKELADLKAALRAGVTPTVAPEEPPVEADDAEQQEVQEVGQTGPGFFEEEEDETIALTGDELDNILNTAEFTEQAGEAEELEDDYLMEPEPPQAAPESAGDDTASFEDEGGDDDSVSHIDLEPVDNESVVFEGDESAIDELADMDIDSELADIEGLSDDSEIDEDDEIDIDLDSLDDVDTSGVLDQGADDAALEAAAEADQQALTSSEDLDLDDLELDDADLDSIDLGDDDLELEEPEAAEDEESVVEEPGDDEPAAADGGFDDFAAAVEEDIAAGDEGVELDEQFDMDAAAPTVEPEIEEDDAGFGDEIEIDLDDIDGFDEVEAETPAPSVAEEPAMEEPPLEEPAPEEPAAAEPAAAPAPSDEESDQAGDEHESSISDLPEDLKQEIRSVLSYMDQLLEALPDDKIEEFAHSEHFEVYRRLFEELGLET